MELCFKVAWSCIWFITGFLCCTASPHVSILTPKSVVVCGPSPLLHDLQRAGIAASFSIPTGCPSCLAWVADVFRGFESPISNQISDVFLCGYLIPTHILHACGASFLHFFLIVLFLSFLNNMTLLLFSYKFFLGITLLRNNPWVCSHMSPCLSSAYKTHSYPAITPVLSSGPSLYEH